MPFHLSVAVFSLSLGMTLLAGCYSVSETTADNCFSSSVRALPDGYRTFYDRSSIQVGNSVYVWSVLRPENEPILQDTFALVHIQRFDVNDEGGSLETVSEFYVDRAGNEFGFRVTPLLADESSIYFGLYTADSGSELWRWPLDGSESPRQLFDLEPGPEGSRIEWMTKVGDQFFLSADSAATNGLELHMWSGDSRELPVLVKQLDDSSLGSNPSKPLSLGNDLWFTAYTEANGREWWRYPVDGSTDPMMINELRPGADSSLINISGATVDSIYHQGRVYFAAKDAPASEYQLWSVDPDDLQTLELFEGMTANGSSLRDPEQFIKDGDNLYFVAGVHNLMHLRPDGDLVDLGQISGVSELTHVGETFYYNNYSLSVGFAPSGNSIKALTLGENRARTVVDYSDLNDYSFGGLYNVNGRLVVVESDAIRVIDRKARCG